MSVSIFVVPGEVQAQVLSFIHKLRGTEVFPLVQDSVDWSWLARAISRSRSKVSAPTTHDSGRMISSVSGEVEDRA